MERMERKGTDTPTPAPTEAHYTRLCDQPGCDEPATRLVTATGRNTGPKEWFGCEAHAARAVTVAALEDYLAIRGEVTR